MHSFERSLKTIHSWLGVLILPWILVIGLTGFYLNHSKAVYSLLPNGSFKESTMDDWPRSVPVNASGLKATAKSVWKSEGIRSVKEDRYHNRQVVVVKKKSGRIIIDKATGYYWVKTRYSRRTYNPKGKRVNTKIYWGRVFKSLHTDGWLSGGMGSWLADITAIAMAVFALSGLVLFINPRIRKSKKKRARLRHARRSNQT